MNLYLLLSLGILLIAAWIYHGFRCRIIDTLYAATQGNPQAQYEAALLYYRGKYVPKDWEQSFRYFSSAAQTGHVQALNNLAAMYLVGHGTKKDIPQAMRCYQQAAEQGDFEAMINLSVLYRVQKDSSRAFTWMKKAADAGSPLGQRMLAEFYYTGIGTEIDRTMGLKYYALAAKQGEPHAVQFLKTRDPRLQHHGPM